MTDWDERFRTGQYPTDPDPSPLLEAHVDSLPDGRALDVATGTGRNAVFLAERGYDVVGLDRSREGLRIARENARERGVDARAEWIETDVNEHVFPRSAFDVVTISFFRPVDRLGDVKAALRPGGVLFVEHHARTTDPTDAGPSGDRYRFGANELLHACLDLTVLRFEVGTETRWDGRRAALTRILARNTTGQWQSYPEL
jgi:SAM-dependent methyltransferase